MTNAEKDAIKKMVKELGEARSENSRLSAVNDVLRNALRGYSNNDFAFTELRSKLLVEQKRVESLTAVNDVLRNALRGYSNNDFAFTELRSKLLVEQKRVESLTAENAELREAVKGLLKHEWTYYESNMDGICVYCGGHEHKTPEGQLEAEEDGDYQVYLDEVNKWNATQPHATDCPRQRAAALVVDDLTDGELKPHNETGPSWQTKRTVEKNHGAYTLRSEGEPDNQT